MRKRMWTGTDDGHLALQNIDQLRQFIKTSPPENTPDTRHARILSRDLLNKCTILQDSH